MRRIYLTLAALSTLLLAAPGSATAAPHGKARHAHHAKRSHHRARTTVFQFGVPGANGVAGSGPLGGASSTTAAAPASPGEPAGKVTSFTGGVLTITLADGTPVSGKVTEATEIHCLTATSQADDSGDQAGGSSGDEQGDSSGQDGGPSSAQPGASGGEARAASAGTDGEDAEEGSTAGEAGGQENDGGSCTSAALTPNAPVAGAELSVGAAGAVWDRIDLMQ